MSTYLTVTIRDKNGEVTKHYHRRCHSFVKQMLQLLEVHHRGVGIANILDTSNTARTVMSSTNHFKIEGGIGIVTKGIVVGSGLAAEANTDYALQTLIAHGVGAGQLSYQAVSFTTTAIVGANVDFIITRVLTNGSGGNVSVNEIGLYCAADDSIGTTRYFCIIRDVLPSTDVIPNGGTYTVTLTERTTV